MSKFVAFASPAIAVLATFMMAGCQTKAQTGALAGGAAGAGLGAIIGHQSGHRAEGALIGGAVGAIAGYIVGNEMDKSDQTARHHWRRAAAEAEPRPIQPPVTAADVIKWTRQGVSDEVIIDRICCRGVGQSLTAADENDLRDHGVSEEVIRAMRINARR